MDDVKCQGRVQKQLAIRAFKKEQRKDAVLFESLARSFSAAVKRLFTKMNICHFAAAAMKRELHDQGYIDAKRVTCGVIGFSKDAVVGSVCPPGHSVVMVSRFLIDPTFGQLRSLEIPAPDYLILPPEHASKMHSNCVNTQVPTTLYTLAVDDQSWIAYFFKLVKWGIPNSGFHFPQVDNVTNEQ